MTAPVLQTHLRAVRKALSDEQARALDAALTGRNVAIVGGGGTGKTATMYHTINTLYIVRGPGKVLVACPYGAAGNHLPPGWRTIHSLFGMGQDDRRSVADCLTNIGATRSATVRHAETLVIDEFFACSGGGSESVLGKVDILCRIIRGVDRPYGGLHLVFGGDPVQLCSNGKNPLFTFHFQGAGLKTFRLKRNFRADAPLQQISAGIVRATIENDVKGELADTKAWLTLLRSRLLLRPPECAIGASLATAVAFLDRAAEAVCCKAIEAAGVTGAGASVAAATARRTFICSTTHFTWARRDAQLLRDAIAHVVRREWKDVLVRKAVSTGDCAECKRPSTLEVWVGCPVRFVEAFRDGRGNALFVNGLTGTVVSCAADAHGDLDELVVRVSPTKTVKLKWAEWSAPAPPGLPERLDAGVGTRSQFPLVSAVAQTLASCQGVSAAHTALHLRDFALTGAHYLGATRGRGLCDGGHSFWVFSNKELTAEEFIKNTDRRAAVWREGADELPDPTSWWRPDQMMSFTTTHSRDLPCRSTDELQVLADQFSAALQSSTEQHVAEVRARDGEGAPAAASDVQHLQLKLRSELLGMGGRVDAPQALPAGPALSGAVGPLLIM